MKKYTRCHSIKLFRQRLPVRLCVTNLDRPGTLNVEKEAGERQTALHHLDLVRRLIHNTRIEHTKDRIAAHNKATVRQAYLRRGEPEPLVVDHRFRQIPRQLTWISGRIGKIKPLNLCR